MNLRFCPTLPRWARQAFAPKLSAAAKYRRDALFLAFALAVALSLAFAPFVFGHDTLMTSAQQVSSVYRGGASPDKNLVGAVELDNGSSGWQTEPWLALEHRIVYVEHRLPFWDPYDGYGAPFAAAMQPQPFYPPTLLLAAHPSPSTFAWWIVFRLFLAGWFTALFLRLFTDRWSALCAGIAAALTGYFLTYYNMPHVSAEVGFPMVLWATELVSRQTRPARIAALGLACGLVYLGGMPESAVLALGVAFLYGIVRCCARGRYGYKNFFAVLGGNMLGAGIGAIVILPFLEYAQLSFNIHGAGGANVIGLAYDADWLHGLLTTLVPHALGGPWDSIITGGTGFTGVRGFCGCAVFMLALLALGTAAVRKDSRTPVVLFLSAVALVFTLKRYDSPLVQWVGSLPLLRMVYLAKYGEPIVGIALACLAGFGVAAVRERRVGVNGIGISFALALGALTWLEHATQNEIPMGPLAYQYPEAFALALWALLVASISASLTLSRWPVLRIAATMALIATVLAEPWAGYIYPTLWLGAIPKAENPYSGAPYLTFLGQHLARDNERTLGFDVLYPNWPGAYGFADPRATNALYPARYLRFVDAFLKTDEARNRVNGYDRFVSPEPLLLRGGLGARWLTLSSVGYLLSSDPLEIRVAKHTTSILEDLWRSLQPHLSSSERTSVHPVSVLLDGVTENALFEFPPDTVTYGTTVPGDHPQLLADIALDPATYGGPFSKPCGSAVTFTVSATGDGRTIATAVRTIDPKHDVRDRRWIPFTLDLRGAAGRAVQLHFSTAAADTCAAWAIWGEPRFVARGDRSPIKETTAVYKTIFAAPGATVARVPNSLPRLSLFHDVRSVRTFDDALTALTAPNFDVRREAVVEGTVPVVGPKQGEEHVSVTVARSDRVEAESDASAPALLVQNDTFFPGWRATVDGRPTVVLEVNGLFRGIAVPRGRHHVVVTYASPVAFAGTIVSACALFIALLLFFSRRLISRARNRPAAID